MNVRPIAAIRGRCSAIGTTVLVAVFIVVGGQTIARPQTGRATNQHPAQGLRTPNSFSPYGLPNIGGRYWPYPVKDPTADERAVVAGRVYRAILDEWAQRAMTTPRPARVEPDIEARSNLLQLMERLGPWSLRWQEAQDNAARSRAARYQAMSDHLGRMSALEDGRFLREAGQATGGLVGPKPPRESAEVRGFSVRSMSGTSMGLFPGYSCPSGRSIPKGLPLLPPSRMRSRIGYTT